MDHSEHSIHNQDHSRHGHAMTGTGNPLEQMPAGHDEHMHSGHMGAGDGHVMEHGMGPAAHHMMSMSFHFGVNETILFSWWQIDTIWGMVGSFIAIFILALLYEGLKYYREYLFWKTYNLLEYRPVTGPSRRNPDQGSSQPESNAPTPVQYVGEVIHKQPPSMLSINHIYQTFLHIVQVTVSFMLMLVFMTYNVWLCIAVVLGAGLGYFLFCWKKSVIVDVTEHCH